MADPPIDFDLYIRPIPEHGGPLPAESIVPVRHYERAADDAWNLLKYVERNLQKTRVYAGPFDRHMQNLRVMVLLSLAEAFERFLKELAAACIDQVGSLILDDRLDVFQVKGSIIASHFEAERLGTALCESQTWCDCDQANRRFKRILADPHTDGKFYVFPQRNQEPQSLRGKHELMSIVWQIRHAIVHNRGVLTASDAHRLRVLCRRPIVGARRFQPTNGDVWYVKLFLADMATAVNREVAACLAKLLTTLHASDSTLFNAAAKAQELADTFQNSSTVAGTTCNPA